MPESMKEIRDKFKAQLAPPCGSVQSSLIAKMSDWIQYQKDAILLAWWAEYGFEPGRATLVDDKKNNTWYVCRATDEEMEERKKIKITNINEREAVYNLCDAIIDAGENGATLEKMKKINSMAINLKYPK